MALQNLYFYTEQNLTKVLIIVYIVFFLCYFLPKKNFKALTTFFINLAQFFFAIKIF